MTAPTRTDVEAPSASESHDPTSVLLRRAKSLHIVFAGLDINVFNFLTRQWASMSLGTFGLLSAATDWHEVHCLIEPYPPDDRPAATSEIARLVESGVLVVAGSFQAARDEEYAAVWAWGDTAGVYHFGIKDPAYLDPTDAAAWVMGRVSTTPLVPLFKSNEDFDTLVQLPEPDLTLGSLSALAKRRSERGFQPEPLSVQQVTDCLFAGFGIMGFLDAGIPGLDLFPLKMAPSGGGRNPYEGYLYARNVSGLEPGIYHYSATENSLGRLNPPLMPEPCVTVGGQDWADDAAAIIYLVADYERVMWKYAHPTGYRVAVIEAGHIGQNICIAAAEHDLVAVPTCAINDSLMEYVFGTQKITHSVTYALVLGKRLPPGHIPAPDVRPFIRSHRHYLDTGGGAVVSESIGRQARDGDPG